MISCKASVQPGFGPAFLLANRRSELRNDPQPNAGEAVELYYCVLGSGFLPPELTGPEPTAAHDSHDLPVPGCWL